MLANVVLFSYHLYPVILPSLSFAVQMICIGFFDTVTFLSLPASTTGGLFGIGAEVTVSTIVSVAVVPVPFVAVIVNTYIPIFIAV